jgi:hypothetical protein
MPLDKHERFITPYKLVHLAFRLSKLKRDLQHVAQRTIIFQMQDL